MEIRYMTPLVKPKEASFQRCMRNMREHGKCKVKDIRRITGLSSVQEVLDLLGREDSWMTTAEAITILKEVIMDNTRDWEEELNNYGLYWEHPTYSEEEEYVMKLSKGGARSLRMAEPDKDDTAPRYLLLREAIRLHVKGLTQYPNNYAKLAVRIYERMQEDVITKGGIDLISGYTPQTNVGERDGEGNDDDDDRTNWEKFRDAKGPFSPEEERIAKRIYELRIEWRRKTYREGRRLQKEGKGDPGTVRQQWLADGTAVKMIISHSLPVEFFKEKLISGYTSKGKYYVEETEEKEVTPEVVISVPPAKKTMWSWIFNLFNWK